MEVNVVPPPPVEALKDEDAPVAVDLPAPAAAARSCWARMTSCGGCTVGSRVIASTLPYICSVSSSMGVRKAPSTEASDPLPLTVPWEVDMIL